MAKVVIVAGGTGLVGGHLIRQLCRHTAYERVIALVRSEPKENWANHDKVVVKNINFDQIEAELSGIRCDEVYCALGTTAKKTPDPTIYKKIDQQYPIDLAKAGITAGAQFFGMVSALGAKKGAISRYSHYKGVVESYLFSMADLYEHIAIAKPSLLLGERTEFRLGESLFSLTTPLIPAVIKPVKAEDVAAALIWAANNGENGIELMPNRELHGRALIE